MFKTIRTWIFRINDYEDQKKKLEKSNEDFRKIRGELYDFIKKNAEARDELKRLVSLLSGETWQEWDNMMEAIEAFQERKYMKEHKEDVITIFTENMEDPEEAARQLLEYFEIEVKEEMQRGKVTFIYK